MIDVVKIIKERGAGRFGTCANCGIVSRDTDDLMKIRVTNNGYGNTLVLCQKCLGELVEKIREGQNEYS